MNGFIYFLAFIGAGCLASAFAMSAVILSTILFCPPIDHTNDLTEDQIGHGN